MKFRAIFNNYKSAHRSHKKKVSPQRFHEHYEKHSNTVIMGLMIGNSHQLNKVKHTDSSKKGNILATQD